MDVGISVTLSARPRNPAPSPARFSLHVLPPAQLHTRLESPAARRARQPTDSCDWLTTEGGKDGAQRHRLQHIASDRFIQGTIPVMVSGEPGTGWRGGSLRGKIDKVKVVSSSVPRPSHCSVWPVSIGSPRAKLGWGRRIGHVRQRGCTTFTKRASLFDLPCRIAGITMSVSRWLASHGTLRLADLAS